MEIDQVKKRVLDAIRESLPPHFRISEQDIYEQKTVYNFISQGKGPPVVSIGGIKFLERDSFLEWLSSRSLTAKKPGRRRKTP